MRFSLFRLLVLAAVPGCVAAAPTPNSPIDPPVLAGNAYRVIAVDGRAPHFVEEDVGRPRIPRFGFGQRSYGGTSGCNFMGGLQVQRGSRLYTYPGPQTQMGCMGPLGEQEKAIDVLFRAAPTIARDGGAVVLSGANHTLRLEPDPAAAAPRDAPEAWQGVRLAGQSFELISFDGASLSRRPASRLTFSARTATLTGLCANSVNGGYVEGAGTLSITWANPSCLGARFPRGTLSQVSGPNGELLFAGDGHWVAGDNLRRDRPK